ncbi:MAG: CHAT domain-containing protein [Actinomycetota bacterium]|nr:CHAT domain-containing protein [Actinomycetota bacterium]
MITTHRNVRRARKRATAGKNLDRANQTAERSRSTTDNKRRADEKWHAQEVARLARPTVRYVHEVRTVEPPKREKLRVLYLTSNPDSNAYLRVDVEVREVRQAIQKATHRELVEVDHRPAATPEDLLDGMNEQRPHVIHFAGHGGGYSLLFDDAKVEDPSGRTVSFDLLARAFAATDTPPNVLV